MISKKRNDDMVHMNILLIDDILESDLACSI